MLNPLQQGLKPDVGDLQPGVAEAAMLNPLQQGLKHVDMLRLLRATMRAAMLNPLQQGLKLGYMRLEVYTTGGRNAQSITTRIETASGYVTSSSQSAAAMLNPLQQGLKPDRLHLGIVDPGAPQCSIHYNKD